jgi:hypothetical protein
MLKALRFWIFGVILAYTLLFQICDGHNLYQAWKVRLKYPVVEVCFTFFIIATVMAPYTRFLQWQNRPRFGPIRGDGPPPRGFVVFPIIFPIVVGLITLAVFDVHECLVNDGLHESSMVSPTGVLVFNLVVVLVYTAFTIRTIGILAKRRKYNMDKNENRSGCRCH